VTGANRHDVTALAKVLDGRVVRPKRKRKQNLCGDKAFVGKPAAQQMKRRGYTPHIRQRGEEKTLMKKGYKPRRWVVEVCHSWLNRFRKILVRYEKRSANYLALLQLAAAIICFRKCGIVYG
jgi:transposase